MSREEARKLMERFAKEAREGGYFLNPDEEMVLDLMEGLGTNQERFGYFACPCRDPDGERAKDLDIICPCDYRDPDLDEFGTCYCALYVSEAVVKGEQKIGSIPERRPVDPDKRAARAMASPDDPATFAQAKLPVWRCMVCGYLCARPEPPLKCPICFVEKDRFERFA